MIIKTKEKQYIIGLKAAGEEAFMKITQKNFLNSFKTKMRNKK